MFKSFVKAFLFATFALVGCSFAQDTATKTQFSVGATVNHTRTEKNDAATDTFFGLYADGRVEFPSHVWLAARVDGARGESLPTLYAGEGREAKGQLKGRGEVGYTFINYGDFRPFASFGLQGTHQFNLDNPNSGFNPTISAGLEFGNDHKASVTGVLRSPWENAPKSELIGYRINYGLTKNIGESRYAIFYGAEYERSKFLEPGVAPGKYNNSYGNGVVISVGVGRR